MKKFTKIIICLVLCFVSVCFVACDKRTTKEKQFVYPTASQETRSNGGLAVRKGDYIYAVNGRVEGKSSEWDGGYQNTSFTHGGLILIKLNSDGSLATDENDLLKDDYYIYMSNLLCGFNATSLYIDGNYLYFVAVSQENENGKGEEHVWARSRVCIWRVSLDKRSSQCMFTSNKTSTGANVEFYSSNGNVFALVVEDDKNMTRVNCNNGEVDNIGAIKGVDYGQNNVAYYVVENSGKYEIKSINVISGEKTDLTTKDSEVTLNFASDNYLYYTVDDVFYSINPATKNEVIRFAFVGDFKDMALLPNDKVLVLYDGVIRLMKEYKETNSDTELARYQISDEKGISSIIQIAHGSVIYVDDSKNVKMVSYYGLEHAQDVEASEDNIIATTSNKDIAQFDISNDDAYMYFFEMVGNHYYTQRVKIANRHEDDKVETLGVYLEEDVPVKEETQE